jgi:hypothetical protein
MLICREAVLLAASLESEYISCSTCISAVSSIKTMRSWQGGRPWDAAKTHRPRRRVRHPQAGAADGSQFTGRRV